LDHGATSSKIHPTREYTSNNKGIDWFMVCLFMVLWNPNDQEYRYNKFIILFFVIPLLYAFERVGTLRKVGRAKD
jgi:hypothetical protein